MKVSQVFKRLLATFIKTISSLTLQQKTQLLPYQQTKCGSWTLCVLTWRVFVYQYGGSSARESARLNNVCKRNSITWWKWLGKRKGQQVLANNVTFLCLWEPEHNHLFVASFLLTVSYSFISLHLAELQVLKTENLWLFHKEKKQLDTILAQMCFQETLPKIAVWTSGRKRERTSRFLSKYISPLHERG